LLGDHWWSKWRFSVSFFSLSFPHFDWGGGRLLVAVSASFSPPLFCQVPLRFPQFLRLR
jgi:hypothetical protein